MTYRNFEIDPHWFEGFVYTHEDYDGAPDANDSRCGSAKSIDEAKKAIDEYYERNVVYAVHHSESLAPAKFPTVNDAVNFCEFWGFDLTRIIPYLHRWEFSFDSL